MPNRASDRFVQELRQAIYSSFADGHVPTAAVLAAILHRPASDVLDGFAQLAAARALVLQPDGEILMAEPFSAVPTPFSVRSGALKWWGNCIWDSLGIPTMLRVSAQLTTSCQCCGLRLDVEIENGERIVAGAGVAHFVVPAARWWDRIVFT
jgi:hypothetical protein